MDTDWLLCSSVCQSKCPIPHWKACLLYPLTHFAMVNLHSLSVHLQTYLCCTGKKHNVHQRAQTPFLYVYLEKCVWKARGICHWHFKINRTKANPMWIASYCLIRCPNCFLSIRNHPRVPKLRSFWSHKGKPNGSVVPLLNNCLECAWFTTLMDHRFNELRRRRDLLPHFTQLHHFCGCMPCLTSRVLLTLLQVYVDARMNKTISNSSLTNHFVILCVTGPVDIVSFS